MPFKRRPLVDFAPDLDPLKDGVLVDCDGFFPSPAGYQTLPGLQPFTPPLPAKCQGAFVAKISAGTIIVAGTSNQLYQLVNGAWVSQGITATAFTGRWRFDSFGNDIIAVNGVDHPFVSHNGATFGVLGGTPPIADLVQTSDFSIFLDTANSFTWWSSSADNIWSLPGIPTETVSAPITASPGNLTAMVQQRSTMTFFKRGSMYVAYFTQPPFFWDIRKVSKQVGCASQEAVVNAGDLLYFPGPDDFYQYDGNSLTRIPNDLRLWFLADLNVSYDYLTAGRFDPVRNLIFWHYSSVNADPLGTIDSWICYNIKTGRWARGSLVIEFPIQGTVPANFGLTYDEFGTMMGFYNLIPDIPYNWPFFGTTGQDLAAIFLPDHRIYVYGSNPPSDSPGPYLTPGDFGDRRNMFQVRRLRPGFTINPLNSQVEVLAQYLQGTTPTLVQTVPMSADGNFNMNVTNRLQRHRIRVFAKAELADYEAEFDLAGEV